MSLQIPPVAKTVVSLHEQMTDTGKESLAMLLGFRVGLGDRACAGFLTNLKDIPALPAKRFTVGAAKRAYLKHMLKQMTE